MGREQEGLLDRLRRRPQGVTFRELRKICAEHFGDPRKQRGSHLIFKTGLEGQPHVNIQREGKMAKAYQCRQVADAIEAKLKVDRKKEGDR